MKHWLVYTISSLLLFSCGKKNDDGAISISLQKRDSLLIEHIAKEFFDDYNPEVSYFLPRQRDFRKQLTYLRKDSGSNYTRERKFKNYHLKSFEFDDLSGRPAYAIEIINTDHEFISFFSFTDEDFYRRNSIDIKPHTTESTKRDSVLSKKINLEKNINGLIQRLGIKKEEDILKFTELVFIDLLSMKKVNQDTIQNHIKFFFSRQRPILNDSIRKYVDSEQLMFFNQGTDNTLMLSAKDGWPGYWRIWIEKNGDLCIVKSAFFSDTLYKAYFM